MGGPAHHARAGWPASDRGGRQDLTRLRPPQRWQPPPAGGAGPGPWRGAEPGGAAAKTNEIPLFTTLLDRLDIQDAVITAGALHAQREHARYLARRGAHYMITIKRNQPGLHAPLATLPWRDTPVAYDQREHGHGRRERRTLKITTVARGLAFQHAAQAIQITRRRKVTGKWSHQTCYTVTSLSITQATPGQLPAIIRGHRGIEDRLHWIRDMDFDAPRSAPRPARRSWPACAT